MRACEVTFNTIRTSQNVCHFKVDILKSIFIDKEKVSQFTEAPSLGTRRQLISIGSTNGLAPTIKQTVKAVIWIYDDLVYGCLYASLGLDELN